MKIVAIVPFLNEESHIGVMLDSVSAQQRVPDRLLLVDDGSTDGGAQIAAEFVRRNPYATLLRRPVRPADRDRMARAHEWRAFERGLASTERDYDVVAKLDADLKLSPDFFAELERHFEADPWLGIAGAYLSAEGPDGELVRQRCPPEHVEGETRFYRRPCLEAIWPIPPILGWDTIDEVRARMRGWRTASIEVPSGDPVHLRRMGSYDGILRGYRRAGWCAYAYGAHPLHVLLAGVSRMRDRPMLLCGLNYLVGWAFAGLRRVARAEPELRRFVRREHSKHMRSLVVGRVCR
jgi:glycosyltransferase involved in cell wall biosynthesis